MDEIYAARSGRVLSVVLNRPAKKNAMTSGMYVTLANIINEAAKDEDTRVVLVRGAGDSFCAGNDVEDFLNNPPGPGESPQAQLINALLNLDKPLIAAVQGAAIGGGTTMLLHFDFVYAATNTKFQMPFVNLALVPEFGSTFSLPARVGYVRAAELILLARSFDAPRAAELGLVTQVVSEKDLLATAAVTASQLASKPAAALRATKRLLKQSSRAQFAAAVAAETKAFRGQPRAAEAQAAFRAFLEEPPPPFAHAQHSAAAA